METQTLVVQRKIIGVLIHAARHKSRRTVSEVAQRLGVTQARVRQYENGAREISLPELELLAIYFQVPISFYFGGELQGEEEIQKLLPPEEMRTRRALLGAKLRQARLAAGRTKEECAQVIGHGAGTIGRYERGAMDIPLTELDGLARFLNVNLYYFIESAGGSDSGKLLDLEQLARLPKEVRTFVLDSNNLPYIRMAMKFRDMPVDKLKELGEILLVVR